MSVGLDLTLKIISSLKNYTGLNQDRLKSLRIKELIDSVFILINSKIAHKISVVINIDPHLELFGDVVGLNQLFMNLITNAVDAMESGGTLTVSGRRVDDRVLIRVQDTGMGIPEAIRARIFEPFFTTKVVGKGTGIGLAVVKREMDRHHGLVTVNSQVGIGTEFVLDFPTDCNIFEGNDLA